MPTNSNKKQSWFHTTVAAQKKRFAAFRARRPHHSFRLTRRRDYVRPLKLPGNIAFTNEVTRTIWKYKKIFGLLVVVYIALYGVMVGTQSQETYASLSDNLKEATSEVYGGDINAVGQAGVVFFSLIASGVNSQTTETQQVFTILLFLLVWLSTVWLLRNLLAGHKVKLRDGLYNSGAPFFAMIVLALIIAIQLIPIGFAALGYSAAESTGLISGGGIAAMMFWVAVALLAILSLYWITSSLFAMVIVTLPGMYPMQAIRTAGDIILGRRIKILLRWLWMAFVVLIAWAIILIPVILLDMGIKSLWPAIQWLPIVPFAMLIMAAATTVWAGAYVYLLYRKVVDYVPKS
ncbi:MAG: hypothetical protein ACOH18_01565 [Candidatus Saccharimonadaceae bacterium]